MGVLWGGRSPGVDLASRVFPLHPILPLSDITRGMTDIVGGKAGNLGELSRLGFPVPRGFCLTAQVYNYLIEESGIAATIGTLLEPGERRNQADVRLVSTQLSDAFEKLEFPQALHSQLSDALTELAAGHRLARDTSTFVAIRSSATVEDLARLSSAGQYSSFINVEPRLGPALICVKHCYASLYSERAIYYRDRWRVSHTGISMAVIFQETAPAVAAGVAFTAHPVTGDRSKIVIEGSWGFGETVVGGAVTPDEFILDKDSLRVESAAIHRKTLEVVSGPNQSGTTTVPIEGERQTHPCLTTNQLAALGSLVRDVESAFGVPQDIEWVLTPGPNLEPVICLVQTRAVTTLDH